MLAFTQRVIALRKRFPGLRRRRFATGDIINEAGLRDVTWLHTNGKEMTAERWNSFDTRCFGELLSAGIPNSDEALLIIFNSDVSPVTFKLPTALFKGSWECLLDTASKDGCGKGKFDDSVVVQDHSLLLLHGRLAG
jgi:glycogen operon protein